MNANPPIVPQPSLTTEYTPRDRGGLTGVPKTISASQQTLQEAAVTQAFEEGPDPSTLPPATAPPSHPSVKPDVPGTLDGRSILDVDINAMAEKPWRRPGSDISDWFNYGFDELSWEAYCYRRRELGDLANTLKANVLVCILIHNQDPLV
jgi:pre-mRNA 3'-end-processing factor FIP1